MAATTKKTSASAKEPKKVEVILDRPHTHGGKDYTKGDKINVSEQQARWLADHGVIAVKEENENGAN